MVDVTEESTAIDRVRFKEWEALASFIKLCVMNSLEGPGDSRGKCHRKIRCDRFNCSSPFHFLN